MSKLFQKRASFKPFDYPDIIKFKEAIQHSYWLVTEWSFLSDVQDYHTKLNPVEQGAAKRAMLAISQIEVAVKKFWVKLGDRFPKAEFDQVGICFGESEVRHSDAYSHLLQILGFNDDFQKLMDEPVIAGRVDYLKKYLNQSSEVENDKYAFTLALFSIFVENVSLFSQFVVLKSFNKYKNVFKDIDNVIQATQQEEQIHAQFGIHLINLMKEEHPEWFDQEFYDKLAKACEKAYAAESKIIDWIFKDGDLPHLSAATVKEYIKLRFNNSLIAVGGSPIFEPDVNAVKELYWFEEELLAEVKTDFFHKKPTSYSKHIQSITDQDLF